VRYGIWGFLTMACPLGNPAAAAGYVVATEVKFTVINNIHSVPNLHSKQFWTPAIVQCAT
jgi:hypothetical protein